MSTTFPRVIGKESGAVYIPFGDPLGQGTFGATCRANRADATQAGEVVCIKVFKSFPVEDVERVKLLARLTKDYRGIANIIEPASHAGTGELNSIILKYCPGTNLRDIFEEKCDLLSPRQQLSLCRNLSITISQFTRPAVQSPVIFSDAAPQNFNVRSNRKSLDAFDVDSAWVLNTRLLSGLVDHMRGVGGTEGYIAPELARTTGGVPSPQSMLWSLAVLMFQMLHNGIHPCRVRPATNTQGLDEHVMVQEGVYPKYLPPSYDYPAPVYPPGVPKPLDELFRAAFLGPTSQRPTAEAWVNALDKALFRRSVWRVSPWLVGLTASASLAFGAASMSSNKAIPPQPVIAQPPIPEPAPKAPPLVTPKPSPVIPKPPKGKKPFINPALRPLLDDPQNEK